MVRKLVLDGTNMGSATVCKLKKELDVKPSITPMYDIVNSDITCSVWNSPDLLTKSHGLRISLR